MVRESLGESKIIRLELPLLMPFLISKQPHVKWRANKSFEGLERRLRCPSPLAIKFCLDRGMSPKFSVHNILTICQFELRYYLLLATVFSGAVSKFSCFYLYYCLLGEHPQTIYRAWIPVKDASPDSMLLYQKDAQILLHLSGLNFEHTSNVAMLLKGLNGQLRHLVAPFLHEM